MHAADILQASRIVPVTVIDDPEDAVPLGRALLAGGIRVLEVTLRTDAAITSISRLRGELAPGFILLGLFALRARGSFTRSTDCEC